MQTCQLASKLDKHAKLVPSINPFKVYGRVNQMVGILLEVGGITPCIGETCVMCPGEGAREITLEAVGFRGGRALMMPVGAVDGVGPGCRVEATGRKAEAMVGEGLVGRVVDGLGGPMDGKGPLPAASPRSLYGKDINPFTRARIEKPLDVGIRAINSLLTVGKGQRMGIMAGSGVGKSVLLGMMAKYTTADINVIALVGERGREVREFIEKDLGAEGLARSVVVVATSDQPPLMRLRAAFLATSVAEYFRDMGRDVLLMMDSATRVAMAQREIGLAAGEPPTTKGYPPSAFALLPKLLERAGTDDGTGSITGFYTVLAEGDDMNDPVADAMRSILDGHIVLSRDIAARGHYPAIDMLQSISRVMPDIVDDNQMKAARRFVEVMADYARNEDLINIGAYKPGSSQKIDFALAMKDRMDAFLRQGVGERATTAETLRDLFRVFE